MNRDTTQGKFEQLKGKAKQSAGEAFGNDQLANSGTADQVKGAAREAWGNTKDAAHAAAQDNQARAETTAHDVREKMTSTAQNVKNSINDKAERFKERQKRAS